MTKTRDLADLGGGFIQAGTGAVQRTVESKLQDVVSVKDFGAVGDGVADDTAAIQAALTSSAKSLFFPSGRYRVTSNLTRSGHTLLHGETMTSSILQMEGTSSFVYTGGTAVDEYNTSQLQIERLSFECPTVAAKSVIDASWTSSIGGGTSKTFTIRDCEVTGTNAAGGFREAIKLFNARNVVIDSVRILGDRDAPPILSGSAILIEGDSDPVEIYITKTEVYFCTNGFEITSAEGVYLSSSTVVACNRAVLAHATSGLEPLLSIIGCHFNTDVAGIYSDGYVQNIIQGNLFYGQSGIEAPASYIAASITNNTSRCESIITGNIFQDITTGIPSNGVNINSGSGASSECIVANNTFTAFDTAVILGSGSTGAVVRDNVYINCTNSVIDQGTSNFIGGFGEFASTSTSGLAQVIIENKSSANNITKQAGYGIRGRDTGSSLKDVGGLRCTPQDPNWVNVTTQIYGTTADSLVPYATFGYPGTPEGNLTAPVGSIATRRDGGAGLTFYVKESGTGNTGWVAK